MTKKTVFLSALMLFAAASCTTGNDTEDYTQYVEPRIGTAHCRYFHFAPGALPYGMAKPGPSTNGSLGNPSGWEATGYDYRDTSIEGFPCVHEFQVGGITLMAMNGDSIFTTPGLPTDTITKKGYRSAYSHDDEVATAGYYSVMLKDYGIRAEMTATERVALQRFTFPKGETSTVLFNIGSRMGESGAVKDASVELVNDTTVEGWVITYPEYVKAYQPDATVPIYFSATVDRKPTKCVAFNDNTLSATPNKATGIGAGLYLQFATDEGEAVTAKVGISYTSVENARLNLQSEAENITFDEAKQRSHDIWQEMLSRIEVETENREDKVKFYSGLYHALLGRGVCSDVNGAYPRNDGSVGQIPEKDGKPAFNVYNTDAMWGGQWNLTQLWLMAYPEHISDFISSHLQVYKDCGWLSDGLANSRFVSGVGTNELTLMIAAAYNCGIRDFDIDLAYEACRKNELDGENRPRGAGKDDTADFVKYGYCPFPAPEDGGDVTYVFSSSHTLEYSYTAYAVAQMAKDLGKTDDYNKLMDLSKGWERIYDSSINFMRNKHRDGSFAKNFNPMQVWYGFQEGNAWQYTFYVPHDPKGLIAKVGEETFTARLDSIFTVSQPKIFSGGKEVGAFAGLETLYNQGNQPCLHISWMFNAANRPSLSQKWVRAILDEFYGTDGIHGYGYGQDEDQGQLGAWYVISSLGLFSVDGLTVNPATFCIGSPIFDAVKIRLNDKYYEGKDFYIVALDNSKQNTYVKSINLNGKSLNNPYLPFTDFTKGGLLTLTMTNEPVDKY